jgi:hypothetical protein
MCADQVNRWLLLAATLALTIGGLVYLWDRAPGSTLLLPAYVGRAVGAPSIFGRLGRSLPSFTHSFAFALLSTLILGRSRRALVLGCGAWWAIDSLFEIGQQASVRTHLVPWLPAPLGHYFAHGTFDYLDLLAIALGAIAAALLFCFILLRESSR